MRIARVVKEHTSDNLIPLIVKLGEVLEGEKRETEWEGWLWCKNSVGVFGWIPEAYLKALPEERMYVATRDYNAKELPVDIGQEVMILEEESSWAWVKTARGDEGWVPLENLEKVTKSDSIPDLM
jgi:uncharacterized protein YgiM (DUF1202 family)